MNETAYSIKEVDYEKTRIAMRYHAISKLVIIPLLIVPAVYFDTVLKALVSVLIYVLSFIVVPILMKCADSMK